jgi:hypothetical protein
MKNFKILAIASSAIAILLSDIMCAVVAYSWCEMEYGIKYEGYSAPANTSLLLAIPYLIGIIICIALTVVFIKKGI